MHQDDYENASPSPSQNWPTPWGEDPIKNSAGRYQVDARLSKVYTTVNKSKDASSWEVYWAPEAQWEHGEEISHALAALDACLYQATKGSKLHMDSLIRGFEEGRFPDRPIAPWKERWMRDKFVTFLVEAKPDSDAARLAPLVLDQWTWAFAWAGQSSQNFMHPMNKAIRAGNYNMAARMMEKIPAEDWLDWTNPYELRSLWREAHWRQGDVSWFNKMAAYDPRIAQINPREGMGPLEMACKEGAAEVVDKLLAQGMRPDPLQSFGVGLAHFSVMGLSHSKWNHKRAEFEDKSKEEIERDATACGKTLAVLSRHGYGMDEPVVKMKAIPGIRRKKGLPKHPETANQFLNRKLAEDTISPSTMACVQQAYMQEGGKLEPTSAAVVSRPRL